MKVLDKGHLELVDHMGSDLTVVNAARVSFKKESDWEYEPEGDPKYEDVSVAKSLNVKDAKLINYLAVNNHWTPFAHPQIQLRIKMPIFVARQWFKHTVGCVYNEVSRRYVADEPEFYIPTDWRKRPDGSVKQGSGEIFHGRDTDGEYCYYANAATSLKSKEYYTAMVEKGCAPEMARMILPQSMYTEFYMTLSLAAAARIAKQRCDSHAQWEIQQYGEALAEAVRPLFPVSWEALTQRDPKIVALEEKIADLEYELEIIHAGEDL